MGTLALQALGWETPTHDGTLRTILQDISLTLAAGEFVGIIGPNGSGKTSSLRCAFRYHTPQQGCVTVNDCDIRQHSPGWLARRVAVVLQEFPEDFGLCVREVVEMGRTPHKKLFQGDSADDHALVDAALARTGLLTQQHQPFATLSGGEKQRVLLARALAQQPAILILDEPTNHLDLHHQLALLQQVRSLRISTLATLHDLNLAAAFCDWLYVLQRGRVVCSGTPQQVLTPALLADVFGVAALVDPHPVGGYPRITLLTPTESCHV